jgi:hypothetical protein
MYPRVILSLGGIYPGPPRTCLGTTVIARDAVAAVPRKSRRLIFFETTILKQINDYS